MGEGVKRKALGEFHGIKGEIVYHQVWGSPANAVTLSFAEPRDVLSSRDGFRKIRAVCNCYLPKSLWPLFHADTWQSYLKEVLTEVNLSLGEVTTLSTGVNMEDMTWAEEVFDEFWVLAFVTAGVKSNAMRVGQDRASGIELNGQFEKLGTINTIVFTSASLDLTTLAASFITITEAKNIALQDMDVRSSYNPQWQASGTGTDQIVVVSGSGERCTYVGGHTKLGELMAKAVTSATTCAIRKSLQVAD